MCSLFGQCDSSPLPRIIHPGVARSRYLYSLTQDHFSLNIYVIQRGVRCVYARASKMLRCDVDRICCGNSVCSNNFSHHEEGDRDASLALSLSLVRPLSLVVRFGNALHIYYIHVYTYTFIYISIYRTLRARDEHVACARKTIKHI